MTNGEKIQQDFECEVCEPIIEDDIIHVIFADKPHSAIGFDLSWWNMEYKEPTAKNDLEGDCISRADVFQVLWNYEDIHNPNYDLIIKDIRALPPVTPQEPILDKIFCIAHPLSIMSTPELEHKAIMQIAEMLEPLCLPESER